MRTITIAAFITCVVFSFSGAMSSTSSTPIFDEINTNLKEKSRDYACLECKDKFDAAYKEVTEGGDKWKKLITVHGECLMNSHREVEAVSLWNKVLDVDPDNVALLLNMGTAFLRLNDMDNAEKYYIKANALKLGITASHQLASIYYIKGVRLNPQNNEADKAVRNTLLSKAETAVQTAKELYVQEKAAGRHCHISDVELNTSLANIKWAQGEKEKAAALLKDVMSTLENKESKHPERKAFRLTQVYFNYGQKLYIDGQKERGLKYMNKAVETAPTKSFKTIKEIQLDLTVNPEKNMDKKYSLRYPQIREGAGIPLN